MPERIAIVAPRIDPVGGTELYLLSVLRMLADQGIAVDLWLQEQPGPTVPDLPHQVRLHWRECISEAIAPRGLVARRRSVARLSGEIAQSGAELLVYEGIAPFDLIAATCLPQMMNVHTPYFTCPAGGRYLPRTGSLCHRRPGPACIATDLAQGCLVDNNGQPFPAKAKARAVLRRPLSNLLTRHIDFWQFNSPQSAVLFGQMVAPVAHAVVQPPIAYSDLTVADIDPASKDLCFVGRVTDFKGIDDAVAVAKGLGKTLHIIGTGPAQERTTTVPNVVCHGWLGSEAMQGVMRQCAVMLMPSRWFETFGMAGAEALAAGLAVAAYDSGGIAQWCRGPLGRTVPVGDIQALTEATQSLIHSREAMDAAQIVAAANVVRETLDPDNFTRGYLASLRATMRTANEDVRSQVDG